MAAPAFGLLGTGVGALGAVTVSVPSGFASGDMLVMFVETANEAVATPPSGWTQLSSSPQGTGTAAGTSSTRLTVYYKIADGSETSYNIGDAGNHTYARILTFTGSSLAIDVDAGFLNSIAATTVWFPAVTTTGADRLVVNAVAYATDTASPTYTTLSNGSLTSLTERAKGGTTSGNGGGVIVFTGVKAAAGSTGQTYISLTSGSSVQALITFAIYSAGDTTAPTLSAQTVTQVTSTSGTPKVTTDEANGTAYMVCVANGDTPSVAQIKAGQNSSGSAAINAQNQAVSTTGEQTFTTVTGLTAGTPYDFWFVHTDAATNDSTAVKADFTPTAPPAQPSSALFWAFP